MLHPKPKKPRESENIKPIITHKVIKASKARNVHFIN